MVAVGSKVTSKTDANGKALLTLRKPVWFTDPSGGRLVPLKPQILCAKRSPSAAKAITVFCCYAPVGV